MFYIEDSTIEDTNNIKEPVKHSDQLLILDGTTCLDYTTDQPEANNESLLQSFWDQVKNI
jgi:hypothetical protein